MLYLIEAKTGVIFTQKHQLEKTSHFASQTFLVGLLALETCSATFFENSRFRTDCFIMSTCEEIASKDFDARIFCLVDLGGLELEEKTWDDLLTADILLGTKKLEARMVLL